MAARRSPVVTLYKSESGLHASGNVSETGMTWPAHVAWVTPEVVDGVDVVVAVGTESHKVAADVV